MALNLILLLLSLSFRYKLFMSDTSDTQLFLVDHQQNAQKPKMQCVRAVQQSVNQALSVLIMSFNVKQCNRINRIVGVCLQSWSSNAAVHGAERPSRCTQHNKAQNGIIKIADYIIGWHVNKYRNNSWSGHWLSMLVWDFGGVCHSVLCICLIHSQFSSLNWCQVVLCLPATQIYIFQFKAEEGFFLYKIKFNLSNYSVTFNYCYFFIIWKDA